MISLLWVEINDIIDECCKTHFKIANLIKAQREYILGTVNASKREVISIEETTNNKINRISINIL